MDVGIIGIIIGTVLALAGFRLTYSMGRRARQRPDLCYVRDFDVLMSPKDELGGGNLRLAVNDHEVKSISRTYIAFFNPNGDAISGKEVVALDPLRLSVGEDDSIQQARVMSQSRPQCGIVLQPLEDDRKTVHINFDFFDAKDGAIVEVLHQGSTPAAVEGTIPGVTFRDRGRADLTPSAIRLVGEKTLPRRFIRRFKENKIIGVLTVLLPLITLGLGVYIVSLFGFPWDRPLEPIPLDGRDLTTLEGQRQFLTDASDAGIRPVFFDNFLILLVVFIIIPVCLTIFSYWNFGRSVVPSNIATDIKQEEIISQEE